MNMAVLPLEMVFCLFDRGFSCPRVNSTAMKNLRLPGLKLRRRIYAQGQEAQLPPDQGSSAEEERSKDNYGKSALERAKAYKNIDQNVSKTKGRGAEEALQRAKAYKKQRSDDKDNTVEVEIITREGIITRKVKRPDQAFANVKDYRSSGISSVDFVGLEFSDKKKKPGFTGGSESGVESLPSGPLPEVEIITGDATKLGARTTPSDANNNNSSDDSALYKPKVATWGIFPRPENISKTYGGGKVIRPGESLETEEEKATREAQTKKLLDDYKEKMGLNVDPMLKVECEKVLKEGDSLMEIGKLREALVCYEKIMKEMIFQSELHGLAALQWSICLDSLSRSNEAQVMYEKLGSHPNHFVRKKAKQFSFGFQAMERMKFSNSYTLNPTSYQKYFEAFDDGYNTSYYPTKEEKMNDEILGQSLPYVIFLLFPIILIFAVIVSKSL